MFLIRVRFVAHERTPHFAAWLFGSQSRGRLARAPRPRLTLLRRGGEIVEPLGFASIFYVSSLSDDLWVSTIDEAHHPPQESEITAVFGPATLHCDIVLPSGSIGADIDPIDKFRFTPAEKTAELVPRYDATLRISCRFFDVFDSSLIPRRCHKTRARRTLRHPEMH